MGRRKKPNGANELYRAHLFGTPFYTSPEAAQQDRIERMYQRILTELAVNRFKWEGFPQEVNVRFLEMCLYYHAISVFVFDKTYNKFFALQGGGNGPVNMLNEPTAFTVVGNQYVGATISAVRETPKHGIAVPIWANYMRVPDLDIVSVYSHKLAIIDRTIEINAKNSRVSKVLIGNEMAQLSLDNIDRQIEEGANAIRVNGSFNIAESIASLDLGVDPVQIEKLHIVRTRLWNECMGLLGIENANQDKKERLVASEVDANNDQTSMTRYVNLNARRIAIDRIKLAYPSQDFSGLKVSYYTDEERATMGAGGLPNLPEVGGIPSV